MIMKIQPGFRGVCRFGDWFSKARTGLFLRLKTRSNAVKSTKAPRLRNYSLFVE